MTPAETTALSIIPAAETDLERYIDLLEELADWLHSRGITQWPRGRVRRSPAYFADSIAKGEVHLAFVGNELAGTLRLLMRDDIVWPECVDDDAVYIYNLGIRRAWAGRRMGDRLLEWSERRTAELGRQYVRLDCMPDNAFLRQYYEQRGFIARGEVDAHYPQPVGVERLRRYEKAVHA